MMKKIIPVTLFLITIMMSNSPPGWSEVDSSQENPLQIAKNHLASVQDRIKAIDQLKTSHDSEMISALSQIIRDPEEPIVLRAHVMELLERSNDQWASLELKKMLKDSSVPTENRILALYALWKKDPQGMLPELINLAQDNNESADIRVAALNYLRTEKSKWPPQFWQNIFLRKDNPTPVRIQAMNGMKDLGLFSQSENMLVTIIENPLEESELRKAVILIASSIITEETLQKAFLSIVSKPENSLEMRRFALDNLALKPNEKLLSQLREILSHEHDPILMDDLKTLTKNTTPKKES